MSRGLSGIPEPVMPEHDLLRSAAPSVRLSEGLKQQVLMRSVTQYHAGRRQRFLMRTVAAVAAVTMTGAVLWRLNQPAETPASAAGQTSVTSQPLSEAPTAVTPSLLPSSTSSQGTLADPQAAPSSAETVTPIPILRPQ